MYLLLQAVPGRKYPGTTIVTDSVTSNGLTTFIESQVPRKQYKYIAVVGAILLLLGRCLSFSLPCFFHRCRCVHLRRCTSVSAHMSE